MSAGEVIISHDYGVLLLVAGGVRWQWRGVTELNQSGFTVRRWQNDGSSYENVLFK